MPSTVRNLSAVPRKETEPLVHVNFIYVYEDIIKKKIQRAYLDLFIIKIVGEPGHEQLVRTVGHNGGNHARDSSKCGAFTSEVTELCKEIRYLTHAGCVATWEGNIVSGSPQFQRLT